MILNEAQNIAYIAGAKQHTQGLKCAAYLSGEIMELLAGKKAGDPVNIKILKAFQMGWLDAQEKQTIRVMWGNKVMFTDLQQSELFKLLHHSFINEIEKQVIKCIDVGRTELWLNSKCPSFIAGCNSEDEMVVMYPLYLSLSVE